MAHGILYQADYTVTLAKCAGECGLVVTSPPYCDARTYNNDVSWTLDDYANLGDAIFKALKPGGHCLFNVDSPVREWRDGFGTERGFHPWKIMLDWAERVGFRVPDRLAYIRLGTPGQYSGRFRNDWEPLFWFQKPGGKGYFDKHSIAEDSNYSMTKRTRSRKADGRFYVRETSGWAFENNKRHRGTAWRYNYVGRGNTGAADIEENDHPARFPYQLAEDIVKCFSPPGGLVCDPFVGGGTSLVAALHNDREFIGGDLFARRDGIPWVDVSKATVDSRYGAGPTAIFGMKSRHTVTVEKP